MSIVFELRSDTWSLYDEWETWDPGSVAWRLGDERAGELLRKSPFLSDSCSELDSDAARDICAEARSSRDDMLYLESEWEFGEMPVWLR